MVMAALAVVIHAYVIADKKADLRAAEVESIPDIEPPSASPLPLVSAKPRMTTETFKALAIADARAFGIKHFKPQELLAAQRAAVHIKELQRLEPGRSYVFGPFELRVVHESMLYQRGATKLRSPHLILEIKNRSSQPRAYSLQARAEGRGQCSVRGSLKANALALGPKERVRLSICTGGGRIELSDLRSMNISRLGLQYISLLPAQALGVDATGAQAHVAATGNKDRCADIEPATIANAIRSGSLLWADVVDFYTRHSCERFKMPADYHSTGETMEALPVEGAMLRGSGQAESL
jgi:hypothetical protein